VVENRGGAGERSASERSPRPSPTATPFSPLVGAHHRALDHSNLPYDTAHDLTAVIRSARMPMCWWCCPARAGRRSRIWWRPPNAIQAAFNYGSAGVGTATHISAERFRLSAGFEATHIPYKGGPEALTDVLGGRIDFYYCPLSTAIPLVRDGRLLALAVSTPTRAAALPDVPTRSRRLSRFGLHDLVWRLHAAKTPPRSSRASTRRRRGCSKRQDAGKAGAACGPIRCR